MAMLTLNSGSQFQENVSPKLDIKAAFYTPYLNKYRILVPQIGSREIFFNEFLSNNVVTLDSAYTASSGTMVLEASTNINPYKVTENVTHFKTKDGAAVYKVTAWNSGTRTATITLVNGSDSSLADETELYLVKYDTYGTDFGTGNGDELQFSTSDINYPTFIYERIKSADGNEDGKFTDVGMNEATISHQEKKMYAQHVLQLERDLFYNVKAAGTGAATRQSNTITSGLDSFSGGLAQFIAASGRVVDNASATPISESDIITDVEYIREVGGLTNYMNYERGENQMSEIDLYCSEASLSDINKFIRLERDEKALSAQTNGQFGSWGTRLIANGAYVNVKVSSGVKTRDYFMVPAGAEIEHKFMYFWDKIAIGKTGHNQKYMYVTGYNTLPRNAGTMVHRKNTAALG